MASSSLAAKAGRLLRGAWWLLDGTRRALLNLLFLGIVVLVVWLLVRGGPPPLQEKTTFVLELKGRITEQASGSTRDGLVRKLRGQDEPTMRLRDLVAAIDAAAKEPAVTQMLLLPEELAGGGLPALREVALAIERFKAAGKPVVAWAASYDQRGYFLAAHATEVWMHPLGATYIEGYGRWRAYYKDLGDKLGVKAHVMRAGRYKNFAETWSASGPSPETLESDGALYGALWASWTGAVEKARKLPAGSVTAAIEGLPGNLQAAKGDPGQFALQQKWVDKLMTPDQMREALAARGVALDRKDQPTTQMAQMRSIRQVDAGGMLARIAPPKPGADAIGVIVAEGGISDGEAGPGSVGGRSTAALVRQAREDDKIKAVVLRVNSPGGSAFGSELVRHELELTRKAGKPVVVSMGDVAASGGYWISTSADEIIADEATITGSIGVVAMLPDASAAADRWGVRTGGTQTTWLAGAYDPRRGLDPRFGQLMQTVIDDFYADFLARVATARKSTPEKIHEIAQGRVWVGKHALERGLVDRTGGLADALESAASRAKLAEGYRVAYVERPRGRLAQLVEGLELRVVELLAPHVQGSGLLAGAAAGVVPALAEPMWADLQALMVATPRDGRPAQALAHCLCVAP